MNPPRGSTGLSFGCPGTVRNSASSKATRRGSSRRTTWLGDGGTQAESLEADHANDSTAQLPQVRPPEWASEGASGACRACSVWSAGSDHVWTRPTAPPFSATFPATEFSGCFFFLSGHCGFSSSRYSFAVPGSLLEARYALILPAELMCWTLLFASLRQLRCRRARSPRPRALGGAVLGCPGLGQAAAFSLTGSPVRSPVGTFKPPG